MVSRGQLTVITLVRVAIVAIGYTVLSLGIEALLTAANLLADPTSAQSITTELVPLLAAGTVIGAVLGPVATHTPGSRRWHLFVWTTLIFLNTTGVILEGVFFAPDLAPIAELPMGLVSQFLIAVGTAGLVTGLFIPPGQDLETPGTVPTWQAMTLYIFAGAVVYVVLFFLVGGLNYTFVTEPYYAAHDIGLVTPPLDVILALELLRGVLLVLSILPFLQTYPGADRRRQLLAATLLFVFAGLVPLLLQLYTLPRFLLFASGYEILLQVGPVGVLLAFLVPNPPEPESPEVW